MDRGTVPINKDFELEYRYYERDTIYKYFNRKFEIYLLEKTSLRRKYRLHMDNCDTTPSRWSPHIHKPPQVNKKLYFAVTTLNWNDVKTNLFDCIVAEIGEENKKALKKAISQLTSPKL
ncbi:MAG: hypothetical protein V1726_07955 [Methanobacteriota archaeon]